MERSEQQRRIRHHCLNSEPTGSNITVRACAPNFASTAERRAAQDPSEDAGRPATAAKREGLHADGAEERRLTEEMQRVAREDEQLLRDLVRLDELEALAVESASAAEWPAQGASLRGAPRSPDLLQDPLRYAPRSFGRIRIVGELRQDREGFAAPAALAGLNRLVQALHIGQIPLHTVEHLAQRAGIVSSASCSPTNARASSNRPSLVNVSSSAVTTRRTSWRAARRRRGAAPGQRIGLDGGLLQQPRRRCTSPRLFAAAACRRAAGRRSGTARDPRSARSVRLGERVDVEQRHDEALEGVSLRGRKPSARW